MRNVCQRKGNRVCGRRRHNIILIMILTPLFLSLSVSIFVRRRRRRLLLYVYIVYCVLRRCPPVMVQTHIARDLPLVDYCCARLVEMVKWRVRAAAPSFICVRLCRENMPLYFIMRLYRHTHSHTEFFDRLDLVMSSKRSGRKESGKEKWNKERNIERKKGKKIATELGQQPSWILNVVYNVMYIYCIRRAHVYIPVCVSAHAHAYDIDAACENLSLFL